LIFSHFMPSARLTKNYVNRLFTSFGTDGPIRNLYYSYLSQRFFHKLIKIWFFHLLIAVIRLIKYLVIPPKKYGRFIYFNWSIAYIKALFHIAPKYKSFKVRIDSLKKAVSATETLKGKIHLDASQRSKSLMPLY
ncbi:MAG: hypothetical protein ACKVOW_21150, partial [Chitinophagaceae bacterium]